jgi:hypothetical protein
MIALRRMRVGSPRVRSYCELDRWSFDPRYTDGRCPICGWQPAGAPVAPRWLILARRAEWELLGLLALLIVLVVLGVVVAHAAGITLPGPQLRWGSPAAAPRVVSPAPHTASPAQGSPSPVRGTASPAHPTASPAPTAANVAIGDSVQKSPV